MAVDLTAIPVSTPAAEDPLAEWQPAVGELTSTLLSRQLGLDDESKGRLVSSGIRTLARCGTPHEAGDRKGAHLVVGEVQSGKTLAFTTLMALARDNGFRLIVVIAGTKKNLLSQTIDRLKSDLLQGSGGLNPWRVLENPTDTNAPEIAGVLRQPRDPSSEIDNTQTVVCFVLKNGQRLRALRDTFTEIGALDLGNVPALIIDDEADQASLNIRAQQGERSPVYSAITELRDGVPRHDFLMYTATPQGPLLIQLEDELSPQTVTVLESGANYVGGNELFVTRRENYVRQISDEELLTALDPDAPSPPGSLRRAIATFLLALVIAQKRDDPKPLSMLIHPASTRDLHGRYARWAKSICEELIGKLDDPKDAAFSDAIKSDLSEAYQDLKTTVSSIPVVKGLARDIPVFARQLAIREVNQGTRGEITPADWPNFPGWIVVGGNKLERGFTIENLAVTYMPRGPGLGHADTVQQRGRFFGYKRTYLDLCRGWFSNSTAAAFGDYVKHEEAMHLALEKLDSSSRPLRDWRRELLLSPSLKPTRKQVITLPTTRRSITSKDGWFGQGHVFDRDAIESNIELAKRLFVDYRSAASDEPLDPRTPCHQSTQVPLKYIHELLADWRGTGSDNDRLLGVSLVLSDLLDRDPIDFKVVFMDGVSSVDDEARYRERTAQESVTGRPIEEQRIELFQGRDPGNRYPGDREIKDPTRPTLQLHVLNLFERNRRLWVSGAPAVSIHLPGDLTTLILQQ